MADEHAFGAELVTPEAPLFAGEATAVITRTSEGDLTILHRHTPLVGDVVAGTWGGDLPILGGHTPLVGDVVAGIVRIERPDGATEAFVVHGGFLQVETAVGAATGLVEGVSEIGRSTRATLLAGVAEAVSAIDVAPRPPARGAAPPAPAG